MDYNRFLPKQECQFMHYVKDELEMYQTKRNSNCVLLFPPLPSRLRYLIHNYVADLPEFTTFSVGEQSCRRVAVCHAELRFEGDRDTGLESSDGFFEDSPRNGSREDEFKAKPKSSIPSRSRGPKRPDKALYMPRAARERLSLENSQGLSGDKESSGPGSSSVRYVSPSRDPCPGPETPQSTESSSAFTQECPPNGADHFLSHAAQSPALCPPSPTPNETGPPVCNHTASAFAEMSLEEHEKDKEHFVPDSLTEEIKAHLKEPETVSIEDVHNDYSVYEDLCTSISADDFPHVIEIYNFPPLFKTDDLLDAFGEYSDSGMKINWVDNTSALGVFSSEAAAIHALSICHPMLKVRALAEGSKKAKAKAIRAAEFIQPVKERPRTDCAVAQRMVTRALGLPGQGRVHQH